MSLPLPDPLIGQTLLDRYEILAPLGHGGSSRVYRAIQQPLGREVAVKVVRSDLDEDFREEFEVRFLREAALAGRLSHSALVTIHDFGRSDAGHCFLVMELLRGRSLKKLIRKAPLQPELAVRLCAELARGLRHAHSAGLVHRDVKPGNVFLVRDDEGIERAKLLDFGLVKEGGESSISGVGTFMGTPHYIAPEQAKGLESVDGRADLYSLGVVLFRMLTGQLPFSAETPMGIAIKHIRETPPTMKERAPRVQVDPALQDIVSRCLEKAPEDRFADAAELAQACEDWLADKAAPRGKVAVRATPKLERAKFGVTPMLLVVSGILGLGVLTSAAVKLGQSRRPVTVAEPQPGGWLVEAPEEEALAVVVQRVDHRAKPKGVRSEQVEPAPAPRGGSGQDFFVDGVYMSATQARAVLSLVNTANEDTLRQAGIYSRGVKALLAARPFDSIQALADAPGVGEKTLQQLIDASGA